MGFLHVLNYAERYPMWANFSFLIPHACVRSKTIGFVVVVVHKKSTDLKM